MASIVNFRFDSVNDSVRDLQNGDNRLYTFTIGEHSLYRISFSGAESKSSSFGDTISYVIQVRTKKQMRRAYAGWVITFMKNIDALRDRTKMYLPRNPMRSKWFLAFVSGTNLTIAPAYEQTARPEPSGPCLFNLLPESVREWGHRMWHWQDYTHLQAGVQNVG